jgi:hypothetical protein
MPPASPRSRPWGREAAPGLRSTRFGSRNAALGLSGLLLCSGGNIIQVLEGLSTFLQEPLAAEFGDRAEPAFYLLQVFKETVR